MQEEKSTLELLIEFNTAALLVPALVLALVYGYSELFDVAISKSNWKTVLFIVWGGTLLIFFREFVKTYISYLFKKKRRARQLDKTLIK